MFAPLVQARTVARVAVSAARHGRGNCLFHLGGDDAVGECRSGDHACRHPLLAASVVSGRLVGSVERSGSGFLGTVFPGPTPFAKRVRGRLGCGLGSVDKAGWKGLVVRRDHAPVGDSYLHGDRRHLVGGMVACGASHLRLAAQRPGNHVQRPSDGRGISGLLIGATGVVGVALLVGDTVDHHGRWLTSIGS